MAFSIKRKATDFKAAHWIERHLPLSQRCFGIATNEQIEAVQAEARRHNAKHSSESKGAQGETSRALLSAHFMFVVYGWTVVSTPQKSISNGKTGGG